MSRPGVSPVNHRWLAVSALVLAVLTWPRASDAAICGGGAGSVCACGDTVNGDVTLTQDLGACGSTGLFVRGSTVTTPITVDCNGFRIFTNTSGAGTVGIKSDCVGTCRANVTVKNCSLEGFATGVDIGNASGWTVQDNTIIGRLNGATVLPLQTGITGVSTAALKILGNDILEATRFGIALNPTTGRGLTGSGNELARNRITVYETAVGTTSPDGAIYLKSPQGAAASPILIHGNYLDCPDRATLTDCAQRDLWFEENNLDVTDIQVYNNVFSGSGAGFSQNRAGTSVTFCPTPVGNTSQYNIFARGSELPDTVKFDADSCQKACVAPPTSATLGLTENTCFTAGPATFTPTWPPAAGATVPPAVAFGADNVILDCNWENTTDTTSKLQLSGSVISDFATATVGILAQGVRNSDRTVTPRIRSTIVGCELETFGTGIRLENSQDFLLRWNHVRSIKDGKKGFYFDIKSDHLQDCLPDNDGDGTYCEVGVDGDGVLDADPNFVSGVNPMDFRHQIYNAAYRPATSQPFNWVGAAGSEKQALYFYGSAFDGRVIDGDDTYFSNATVGHLTLANIQNVTVRDYLPGGNPGLSGFDPIKLVCVGMVRNGKCDTPQEAATPQDPTPQALVDRVGLSNARVGIYALNSARLVVQNSQASNTAYGLLLFNTASTTVGCAAANCNRFNANDEGIRAQRYGNNVLAVPATPAPTRLLVWNNQANANKNGGILLYHTDVVTVRNNTIQDSGLSGDPAAIGLLLAGVQDGNVYDNTVTLSRGDNLALVTLAGSTNIAATRNFIYKNKLYDSVSGHGAYVNNALAPIVIVNYSVVAPENFFGWKQQDGTVCPTGAVYPNSPCTGLPPQTVWPALGAGAYNNEMLRNIAGGLAMYGDIGSVAYRNDVQNNGKDSFGSIKKLGSSGMEFAATASLEAHDNRGSNNTGWGMLVVDSTPANVSFNTLEANDGGGLSVESQIRTPVTMSSEIRNNTVQDNRGPALQFLYARYANVVSNTVRFQAAPGVMIGNSVDLIVQSNAITSTVNPAPYPYLTVAALPGLPAASGFVGLDPSLFYRHEIYQSNTAGPTGAIRPVYYYENNQAFLPSNTKQTLAPASRVIEYISPYHLQISNSDQFTVQNVTLTNADPLDFAYVSDSNENSLTLSNCLGPCLRLFQSEPIGANATTPNTFDNATITNPLGDGVVVVQSDNAKLTDLTVSTSIEGDAVRVERSPSITVACENCSAGKNTLTRAADPLNRFWELQVGTGSGGNFYGNQFANRGAFEITCQPGRDNCCLATDDAPDVCDPDCGLDRDGAPVDRDCSACTATAGNCCLAAIDAMCDPDCPDFIDPDCWTKANGAKNDQCDNNGRVPDNPPQCDYDCSVGGVSDDPDCRPKTCSNTPDGCCNASDEPGAPGTPGAICDPDCSSGTLQAGASDAIVDPDCNFSALPAQPGCYPAAEGICDADCPSGFDPDCSGNSSGLDTADDRCNGQNDGRCDPDCLGSGNLGNIDPDCDYRLCTFRPSFQPANTFSSVDGSCPAAPADDTVCDRDCIAAGTDPDCTELDCCFPAVDGSCDADCPFGVDPDCAARAQQPTLTGCQPWRDGGCDYACSAGQDPDCPAPAAPATSCTGQPNDCCNPVRDLICDPDCGTSYVGNPVDPDCGQTCGTAADGCCLPTDETVSPAHCDPDCGLNANGTPVDPDCVNFFVCTNAPGNCCVPDADSVCDLDCPSGADPDCAANDSWCGDRSSVQANVWPPATIQLPYTDDVNYGYEKGVPNSAASCVAPLVRFKPAQYASQYKLPRSYSLAQRNLARGDVKIQGQYADYEGSGLVAGVLFGREPQFTPWRDPQTGGWLCGTVGGYLCSSSYFNAETNATQPITPAEPAPLPLPLSAPPSVVAQPPPHPSVDNTIPRGPGRARLGTVPGTEIKTRQWPNPNLTPFDPLYLTDVTYYWAAASSTSEGGVKLDGTRQTVWLELMAYDNDLCKDPLSVNSGCFSAGYNTTIDLCDAACAGAPSNCALNCSQGTYVDRWTQRQRMVVDLQGPILTGAVNQGIITAPFTCGGAGVRMFPLDWPWASGEETFGDDSSWTAGKAHYEVWYGQNRDEVLQRKELSGGAGNGPFVWEDVPRGSSGLPHETCDWSPDPTYDANLAALSCNQPDRCRTNLLTTLTGTPFFNVCAVDDFGNTTCIFTDAKPWLQTKYGDVYAGSNLQAEYPAPNTTATFLITSAGSITNWTSESTVDFGSGRGLLPNYPAIPFPSYHNDFTTPAGSLWFLHGFNGNNFATDDGVIEKLKTRYGASRVEILPSSVCSGMAALPGVLDGKIYYYNGNCTIGIASSFANGIGPQDASGLFLINGDLTINNAITYSGEPSLSRLKNIAAAAWIVLGGVTINPMVSQVDSSILALGSYAYRNTVCNTVSNPPIACGTIDTGSSGTALIVRGILMAREFLFQRTFASLGTAAETILYDGRITANPPLGLEEIVPVLPVTN